MKNIKKCITLSFLLIAETLSAGTGGAWLTNTLLSSGSNIAGPKIAVNCDGIGMAVWVQQYQGIDSIFAAKFDPSTGEWQAPQVISSNSTPAFQPSVAIDCDGKAYAIWAEGTNPSSVLAAIFDGTSWQAASLIATTATTAYVFLTRIVVDCHDHVLVAWLQYDSGFSIYSARFDGTSWQSLGILSSSEGDFYLTMDCNGNGYAVWAQDGDTIKLARFVGTAWLPAETIQSQPMVTEPRVAAVDCLGNLVAIWEQFDSDAGIVRIAASYYDSGTLAWSTPTYISPATGQDVLIPQITTDCNGHAIAVWPQLNDSFAQIVNSARFDFATKAWDYFGAISSINASSAQIAADCTNGNAIAVWQENDGGNDLIYAALFDATTLTWQTPQIISNVAFGVAGPYIGIDCNGNALAIWNDENAYYVYANRYVAFPTITTQVTPVQHRFPTQIDCINVITWDAITTAPITAYNLYYALCSSDENDICATGTLLAKISALSPLKFEHHGLKCGECYAYCVQPVLSE